MKIMKLKSIQAFFPELKYVMRLMLMVVMVVVVVSEQSMGRVKPRVGSGRVINFEFPRVKLGQVKSWIGSGQDLGLSLIFAIRNIYFLMVYKFMVICIFEDLFGVQNINTYK